jgi:hypothetical protein
MSGWRWRITLAAFEDLDWDRLDVSAIVGDPGGVPQ